jgi:hypothetical protein
MPDIRMIASMLGGSVTGRDSCNVPGPNHSRKDRSLSIRITHRGFVVHSFAGDDWRDCRDYVRGKLGLADDWKPKPKLQPNKAPTLISNNDAALLARRKQDALKFWNQAVDPRDTLVEVYLREHRGLTLPDSVAGTVIRFNPNLFLGNHDQPGMICLLRNIVTDEPTGIHRTFLSHIDAGKIDRMMLGVAKGAAIKLDPKASDRLTIGEGVETVLAAREAGFSPAWALGSAPAIGFFPVLRGVHELTILLENDPTSHRAVSRVLNRYRSARRVVKVIQSRIGSDFNDAWKARNG